MTEFKIDSITPNYFFSKPLYLDEGFVLAAPEMKVTRETLDSLKAWGFGVVFSEGEPADSYQGAGSLFGENEEMLATLNDDAKLTEAEKFYQGFLNYTNQLYVRAGLHNSLSYEEIAERVKGLCEFVKRNQRFILQVMTDASANKQNFLASHAVKSTVFSLIIGLYFKMPMHRLIELGIAALVHEIGMVRLPSHIYMSANALTAQERRAIVKHPEMGLDILKAANFPLSVSIPALEHHERENGSGYPRKLTGDKIGYYSKIIAVACSYEAITAARPHKDARDGYAGMMDMLRNEGKQYDDSVIRAIVFSLSIFPIGMYVLLSNGKSALVIDANPEDPRFPIVQVFGELTPDGKNKILKTSRAGIRISRPLEKSEISFVDASPKKG